MPLILITNDDGYAAKGIQLLTAVAREFGEVVVMAPDQDQSGRSCSLTTKRPLRVKCISESEGLKVYACDGTPVDCVKMATEHFCYRPPDLVLSGINHGSNASINSIYSATMGAVIEACLDGFPAIGISLLHHSPDADLTPCSESVRKILRYALDNPLPSWAALNVNIPRLSADKIKGIRVCRAAKARWCDSLTKREDPIGRPYWWMTGRFEACDDAPDTDLAALNQGYVSVVPIQPDFTSERAVASISRMNQDYSDWKNGNDSIGGITNEEIAQ